MENNKDIQVEETNIELTSETICKLQKSYFGGKGNYVLKI